MLAHRLRRWPNIKATLFQCVVIAGEVYWSVKQSQAAVTAYFEVTSYRCLCTEH